MNQGPADRKTCPPAFSCPGRSLAEGAARQANTHGPELNGEDVVATNAEDDIIIGRSVGSKARNYDVVDSVTGEIYHFVEGTRMQDVEVFAGYRGTNPLLEEVAEGLAQQRGGVAEKWQHAKGFGYLDVDGEAVLAEIHWFQEASVGKVHFQIKDWFY